MMDNAINISEEPQALVEVQGFEFSGVHCDVRETGDPRLDLAFIYSSKPCTAAGVFTLNDVKAAPVKLGQQLLKENSHFHGILTNSGNANACTGPQGDLDAKKMMELTGQLSNAPANSIFVCSTGRIGRVLPMPKLESGIKAAVESKSSGAEQAAKAAKAILTSDTRSKTVTASFTHKGKKVTLSGIAKGAGMIEPNMATMLAYVVTDADISHSLLQATLSKANTVSFNAITVDGDMSTNDTVLCLANGASGVTIDEHNTALLSLFEQSLTQVCQILAKKIVSDGEKVTKQVTIKIEGAPSEQAAEKVARAIGNSLLVKTSWYGNDPNWGRIMDAAGYARIGLIEEKLDLFYNDCPVLKQGTPADENLSTWKAIVSEKAFTITLNLNLGPANYQLISADLSEAYVDFNKSE